MSELLIRKQIQEIERELSKQTDRTLEGRRDELILALADSEGCNSQRGIPR
jgi:hypothetical protein